MIKLSYEQIIEKIRDQTKKPFSEIEILVNKKLEQLSDLISKQGAAHIIANELKVKLFDKIEGRLKIKDLVSGMNSVEVLSKVIKIYGIREFEKDGKQGKVASILIGDETGTCRMTLWDTNHIGEIEKNNLMEEKVVLVKNAYVKENNGFKEIHLGNRANIVYPNEKVNVISYSPQQAINTKKIKDLEVNDYVSIEGTIVQVFDPRFYDSCPECRKKLNEEGKCEVHGVVEKKEVPIINIFLDDGTENIRVVMFGSADQLIKNKETLKNTDEFRDEVLGKQLKIQGKVIKNEMFDRNEFRASIVEELKPEDIIK
ncbi:hypothetical protein J4446_00305 [Candidatus Woesearchaeota archaeon]|nr:hypothetical protein [Candidatus Woesearchaeota archaeon]